MKLTRPSLALILVAALMGALILFAIFSPPANPVAVLRVVDAAGKPIAGAVIVPDGLRPKSAYAGGHYGWLSERMGVTNSPVITDANGDARIPYPKYVRERIETGEISFSVNHTNYVPDRSFRSVSVTPPDGAPAKEWLNYWLARVRFGLIIVRPDPVVLQQGAVLRIIAKPNALAALGSLHAQLQFPPDR